MVSLRMQKLKCKVQNPNFALCILHFSLLMYGWLLDIYPASDGMRVWIIGPDGRAASYIDNWSPFFYLEAQSNDHEMIQRILTSFQISFSFQMVERSCASLPGSVAPVTSSMKAQSGVKPNTSYYTFHTLCMQ